jgi:poly(A) polymerase
MAENSSAVCKTLVSKGYAAQFRGFSAIDRYLCRDSLPFVFVETSADLQGLVRLFENLRFPGSELADGAVTSGGRDFYFRCLDDESVFEPAPKPAFPLLDFSQDCKTGAFIDPRGVYPLLREILAGSLCGPWWMEINPGADEYKVLTAAAMILARYAGQETGSAEIKKIAGLFDGFPNGGCPGREEQRMLLSGLLCSANPGAGLELLKIAGFAAEFWPELASLDAVDHSKEFHPEGNVWSHTLETFRHRKPGPGGEYDLTLSLGLLLHDSGKPLAGSSGGRRFDGHAELGAMTARRFLERLGFDAAVIENVFYLVKNHMLPAALKRLPLNRTGEIMESPLFPVLMELYRCDEASSFKGLDGYYENSAVYHAYLKYRRNPYRSADGKVIGRRQRR